MAYNRQAGQESPALKGMIFIIGPAYSGKSRMAHSLLTVGESAAVLAYPVPDEANAHRVLQQASRFDHNTAQDHAAVVIQKDLADQDLLTELQQLTQSQVILDSVNLWLARAIIHATQKYNLEHAAAALAQQNQQFCAGLKSLDQQKFKRLILISSEVGAGLPSQKPAERLFRRTLGELNQLLAAQADHVFLMTAGIALPLKGSSV